MASSGVDIPGSAMADAVIADHERKSFQKEKNSGAEEKGMYTTGSDDEISVKIVADHTHRQLRPRHIQLIGIGGTIGTALYVAIGRALLQGGPGSLFIAFTLWYVLISRKVKLPQFSAKLSRAIADAPLGRDSRKPPREKKIGKLTVGI